MEGIGNEIRIINQLQDVFKTLGGSESIGLPQIVVVGAQSSGKSSVLESIVGWDFLPRGSGIVTRCPLFLQLMYVPAITETVPAGEAKQPRRHANSKSDTESITEEEQDACPKFTAQFSHNKNVVFTSPEKIREEIEKRTNEIAGKGKNVAHEPIVLKISAPSFIDLTLVDLPGLMKNPVGDQPLDIEQQTEELIMSYITNENSIILAVTPMNADMVNSDSIKLARVVDPKGDRTIVVLTKLDIMDDGTNAKKEMLGDVLSFKLGIIGVTNRTQKEIETKKTIAAHLMDEKRFFETNYKDVANMHGVPFLAKKLNKVLMNHIRERMQNLRQRLEDAKASCQSELAILGQKVEEKSVMVNQVLKKFAADYREAVLGSTPPDEENTCGGGARLNEIFHNDFLKALAGVDPLGSLILEDVKNSIEKCGGLYPTLFIPEVAFRRLSEERIRSFKGPVVECAKQIYQEMEGVIGQSSKSVQRLLDRFPNLRDEIYEVVRKLLENRYELARELAEELVEAELSYIDTKHPQFFAEATELVKSKDFKTNLGQNSQQGQRAGNGIYGTEFGGNHGTKRDDSDIWAILKLNAIAAKVEPGPLGDYGISSLSAVEVQDIELICRLVVKYFFIVRQNIQTGIPKAVVLRLVKYVAEHVEDELVKQLYETARFDELLLESQHTASRRAVAQAMLMEIEDGLVIIRNVRNHKLH